MNVREWALVAFTILAQMSVGSFLVLNAVHLFLSRRQGEAKAGQFVDRALLGIWPALALGLLASLFHLGNPLSAYRAVANIGTSWLSREITFGVLFAVVGIAFTVMQWRKIGSSSLRTGFAWLAGILGIVLVYSMSMVYMIPTRPSWNLVTTPLSFFTTTLLMGVLAMGVAFVANYTYARAKDSGTDADRWQMMRSALRWIAVASIILLGCQFVILPFSLALTTAAGAGAAVQTLASEFGGLFVLRLVLVFAGAGILGLYLHRQSQASKRETLLSAHAYAAFVFVLVAEVVGRFLFYSSAVKFGLQ